MLERWGAVLPHDRVHVLPMAPGRSEPGELLRRFLGVLGLDDEGLEVPASAANASLGLVEVELLRRVNAHLGDFRSAVRPRHLDPRLPRARAGCCRPRARSSDPREETLADLVARGERARRMLREEGFDVVGDRDLLEPGDLGGRRHPDEVDDAEMLACADRGDGPADRRREVAHARARRPRPGPVATTETVMAACYVRGRGPRTG